MLEWPCAVLDCLLFRRFYLLFLTCFTVFPYLALHRTEFATSRRLIYKSFTAVAKPVSTFVAILTGNAHVFMHACLRAVPNVFTA